jgi:hypothetical protein
VALRTVRPRPGAHDHYPGRWTALALKLAAGSSQADWRRRRGLLWWQCGHPCSRPSARRGETQRGIVGSDPKRSSNTSGARLRRAQVGHQLAFQLRQASIRSPAARWHPAGRACRWCPRRSADPLANLCHLTAILDITTHRLPGKSPYGAICRSSSRFSKSKVMIRYVRVIAKHASTMDARSQRHDREGNEYG